jgi:hypothetical protein
MGVVLQTNKKKAVQTPLQMLDTSIDKETGIPPVNLPCHNSEIRRLLIDLESQRLKFALDEGRPLYSYWHS